MSYRQLVARPVLNWALVAIGTRLPVAMAPLALVFLVRERPGGYALGAGLAAAYVIGEVAGAAVLGPRITPRRARFPLAAGLALGACSFAGLGLLPQAPPLVRGIFAVLAGSAPAAAPGGLRTLLTSQLPDALVVKALSAESVLTYGVWTVAPALTGVLALAVAPSGPLVLAAALMAAATAGMWALPAGWDADRGDREDASLARTLARAWPVYLTGAAAMSLLALAELVLPALLVERAIGVGWRGRSWRGSRWRRSSARPGTAPGDAGPARCARRAWRCCWACPPAWRSRPRHPRWCGSRPRFSSPGSCRPVCS